MGDRGNIFFVDSQLDESTLNGIYLYTHYSGSDLWRICRDGLERGKNRWGDSQYLARILFSEFVRGIELKTTGAGISTYVGDNEHRIIRVNDITQTVSFHDPGTEREVANLGSKSWSYREYLDAPHEDVAFEFEPERYA